MALVKSIVGNEICDQTARDSINNMSIGGRNFLRNSADFNGWAYNSSVTSFVEGIIPRTKAMRYDLTNAVSNVWKEFHNATSYNLNEIKSFYGNILKVSFYARNLGTSNYSLPTTLRVIDSGKNVLNYSAVFENSAIVLANSDWSRYVGTINMAKSTIPSLDSNSYWYMYLVTSNMPANVILELTQPKLEIGNKRTDWTPALEDYAVKTTDDGNGNVTILTI